MIANEKEIETEIPILRRSPRRKSKRNKSPEIKSSSKSPKKMDIDNTSTVGTPFKNNSISSQPSISTISLAQQVKFARFLRRRADLYMACNENNTFKYPLPEDMSSYEIAKELSSWKENINGKSRFELEEALTTVWLKELEHNTIYGDGFDHGRHFLTIDEYIEYITEDKTDADLRKELLSFGQKAPKKKKEKLRLLEELVQGHCQASLRLGIFNLFIPDIPKLIIYNP